MSETIVVPDNGNNNGWNSPLGLLALGGNNNSGFLGGNGLGAGIVGFLIGALCNGGFGNGNGLFGGNNSGAAAASLGAQATALNNTDLILQAITSQGERQSTAVQTLSTMLGQDFNLTFSGVQTVQNALATIAANQGTNVMQIINAIQAGDAALQSQLCSCCCETQKSIMQQGYENQIATLNQTNSLNNTINANGQRNVDAIADLKSSMISEFCAARERDMQAKIDTQADIITQLRGAADNANQTNQIIGYVNSVVSPLQTKVNEIASKQLPTVPVVYPNIQAYNATPYMGGFYGNGFFGNGFGNSITF